MRASSYEMNKSENKRQSVGDIVNYAIIATYNYAIIATDGSYIYGKHGITYKDVESR